MTPETKVKKKMDKLMMDLANEAGLEYQKDTFGPFLRNGFPDSRYHLGSLAVFAELKAEGKTLAKLQELEKARHERLNYVALEVIGSDGVDALYSVLLKHFHPDEVAKRVHQEMVDAGKLLDVLEKKLNARK